MSDEVDKMVEEAIGIAETNGKTWPKKQGYFYRSRNHPTWKSNLRKSYWRFIEENPDFKSNRGRIYSDPAIRKKISERTKEAMATDSVRDKLSEAQARNWQDPSYRKKVSDGMKRYYENKPKLPPKVKAKSPRVQTFFDVYNTNKAIVCVETGMVYPSAKIASDRTGAIRTKITAMIKGRIKSAGGYHWRYATPEEVAYFWAERERTGTDGPFPIPGA